MIRGLDLGSGTVWREEVGFERRGRLEQPMDMRLVVGQRMNMHISGRKEAHCSHYAVVETGRTWDFFPAVCQLGNNGKNQDAWPRLWGSRRE